MTKVAAGYENFMGGQLSSVPVNELNDNQLVLCENAYVTLRDKPGVLTKRKGYVKHWDESGTFPGGVIAVHNFTDDSEVDHLFVAVDDGVSGVSIREITGAASSTEIANLSPAVIAPDRDTKLFTTADGKLGIVTDGFTVRTWDGVTLTVTTSNATRNAIGADHDGRLWFSDDTVTPKNKLQFSAVGDSNDYATVNNSGFIVMNMPKITAIGSIGDNGLVVLGEQHTFIIEGDGFQTYHSTELSNTIGTVAHKTLVSFGGFALFLSDEGVISVSAEGLEKVSLAVDDIISPFTAAQLATAAAFRYKELYVLCYDSDDDDVNDKAVIFDTRFGIWTTATNFPFSGGTRNFTGSTWYVGDDGKAAVYRFDEGTTDDGTDIVMTARTRGFDFDRFFARKIPRRVYFQSNRPGLSTNLDIQLIVDGVSVGPTQPYDLEDGEDDLSFVDSGSGYVVQLEFTNSGTADVVELRSLILIAEERPAGEII